MSIRLGYAAINCTLKEEGIITNRTCRLKTVGEKGKQYLVELGKKNMKDLLTILKWNEKHGIKFFRMTSNLFPHIDNPILLNKQNKKDYKKMVYPIKQFKDELRKIGNYANKHKHRITMHPDPYLSLGGSDPQKIINAYRILFMHTQTLEYMNMPLNSTITIHGGGVYGDKVKTIKIWKNNFNKLPLDVKKRVILENDEFSYSISDVLNISASVNQYDTCKPKNSKYKIPIVFDYFHYQCYSNKLKKEKLPPQYPVEYFFPLIVNSWGRRQIKMHLSEQNNNKRTGAHSDYVKNIPKVLLDFPNVYGKLDLMIEAKCKELAIFKLRKKYKKDDVY